MDVRQDNLDNFWLEGKSKVSQKKQIALLVCLHDSRLPFGEKRMSDVRAMMVRERTPTYTLSGKTGWTGSKGHIGWFVGYVESEGRVYYFATKSNPIGKSDTTRFLDARIEITVASLKLLGII